AGLHCYTAVHDIIIPGSAEWTFKGRPMGTYNTLVDLMGHKDLGAKTVLYMIDGLYAVEEEDHPVSLASRWKSFPFNNHWSSSLFLSQDNIAIESVGLDFIRTEQSVNSNYTCTYGAVDNYLHEGSQADNPPSGTYYSPNGDSVRLPSLGVHEHWNNPTEKKYSRNLGTGNGIELVQMQNTITSVKESPKPAQFALYQNYPNPFNPSTTIRYSLSGRSTVTLNVYNTVGQLVATLVKGEQEPGMHEVKFDGTRLSSGVYYYRIQSGGLDEAKKLLLVR
ncbi:MAG TPA: T9SS type A sorting domain-containing protein, partial [Bacteroidota bacterium]|nr:T9SS type A sorting domain-containing protein [Bacteroidota bacterium]